MNAIAPLEPVFAPVAAGWITALFIFIIALRYCKGIFAKFLLYLYNLMIQGYPMA